MVIRFRDIMNQKLHSVPACRASEGDRPDAAHICDPPEAFIFHREIVLAMKPDITLRAYLTTEAASIAR